MTLLLTHQPFSACKDVSAFEITRFNSRRRRRRGKVLHVWEHILYLR